MQPDDIDVIVSCILVISTVWPTSKMAAIIVGIIHPSPI
ncbi:hypothetical protein Nizo2259_2918 [Lactiplantibacillus plantarum]|uniref:Uncharacterized protein n=1 Tax=Lactiplantibacillus plantarum TaxID=1590 RepID=A0A166ASG8_LACPN|nr:Hypothetical protein zj316_1353 [Lactiplantibacillus plantarum ZJ316]AGL63771.2 hypothetical protein LBP_cg1025 [Lactiplantibacillus plantarum subsp. plantarum P-8]ALC08329.1 hypothetical protein JM48_1121 [Lactiplantibacillus plantarum]ETF10485.1 hypothetical protein N654_2942 [Lactiplantibacillus plantarum 4_3]AOG31676.1 Hypothetical protein AWV72_00864 [Lactiplantibacillus plantarum]